MVQHSYSCLFGTFLCNSGKEREDRHVQERTCSVWSLLRPANRTLRNMLYSSHSEAVGLPFVTKSSALKPVGSGVVFVLIQHFLKGCSEDLVLTKNRSETQKVCGSKQVNPLDSRCLIS